jgi:hypothetical protein
LLAFKGFLHLAPLHREIFDHTLAFGKSDSYRLIFQLLPEAFWLLQLAPDADSLRLPFQPLVSGPLPRLCRALRF